MSDSRLQPGDLLKKVLLQDISESLRVRPDYLNLKDEDINNNFFKACGGNFSWHHMIPITNLQKMYNFFMSRLVYASYHKGNTPFLKSCQTRVKKILLSVGVSPEDIKILIDYINPATDSKEKLDSNLEEKVTTILNDMKTRILWPIWNIVPGPSSAHRSDDPKKFTDHFDRVDFGSIETDRIPHEHFHNQLTWTQIAVLFMSLKELSISINSLPTIFIDSKKPLNLPELFQYVNSQDYDEVITEINKFFENRDFFITNCFKLCVALWKEENGKYKLNVSESVLRKIYFTNNSIDRFVFTPPSTSDLVSHEIKIQKKDGPTYYLATKEGSEGFYLLCEGNVLTLINRSDSIPDILKKLCNKYHGQVDARDNSGKTHTLPIEVSDLESLICNSKLGNEAKLFVNILDEYFVANTKLNKFNVYSFDEGKMRNCGEFLADNFKSWFEDCKIPSCNRTIMSVEVDEVSYRRFEKIIGIKPKQTLKDMKSQTLRAKREAELSRSSSKSNSKYSSRGPESASDRAKKARERRIAAMNAYAIASRAPTQPSVSPNSFLSPTRSASSNSTPNGNVSSPAPSFDSSSPSPASHLAYHSLFQASLKPSSSVSDTSLRSLVRATDLS